MFSCFHDRFTPLFFGATIWSIFWYFSGWIMYSLDYRKTRDSLQEFLNKTVVTKA